MGLMALSLSGVVMPVFVGTFLIYREIEKQTLFTVLSKPIRRSAFILGKFFGLLMMAFATLGMLTITFLGYFYLSGGEITNALILSIGLIYVQTTVVVAITILLSSATNPILSGIFTLMLFSMGRLSQEILWMDSEIMLSIQNPENSEISIYALYLGHVLLLFTQTITPAFQEISNFSREAVSKGIDFTHLMWILFNSIVYIAAMLCGALWIFQRRNF